MRRLETCLAWSISVTLLTLSGCGPSGSPSAIESGGAEDITLFIESNSAPADLANYADSANGEAVPGVDDEVAAQVDDAELWSDLEQESIQLEQKLLLVKGSKGVVACSYLNVETFNLTEEACAIVPAADFDVMLDARVTAVSNEARQLGIYVGMSGREALKRIR